MAEGRSIIRRVIAAFDRDAAKKMESEFEGSLQKAGEEGGKKAGAATMTELRKEFDKRKAELSRDLAAGVIDQKEFKKQTDIAAQTFNAGVLKLMDEAKAKGAAGEREFNKLGRSLKRVGDDGEHHIGRRLVDALKKAALAAAALFGIRQVIRFGRESIRAAEALRATQRGLEQQLHNSGIAWANVSHEVRQHARALWDTHRLTHGEVMDTLRQLIVVTGDYETSLRSVGLVHDIVKATGLGVEQASRLLGRALNGEINVFNRYGVAIDQTRDVLEQLQERFGGAAKAGTTAGEALTKAWGDFREAFGEALLNVAEGESVLDRVTNAVRWMSDNIDELLATVKALTIAIGIMIGVSGLAGMVRGFRAATAAAITLRTALQGFYAMLGPKGWFVLGVVALTEAIRRKGAAARQAARDVQEWRDSLRSMSIQELEQELIALARQRRTVEEQLQRFSAAGNKRLADDARRRLAIIERGGQDIINHLNRLRAEVDRPTARPPSDDPVTAITATADARDSEAEALARQIEQQEAFIEGMRREIEVHGRRAAAILDSEEAVEALNRELFIEEALLRSGAEAGSEFEATVRSLAAAQYDAAEAARLAAESVVSDWTDAAEAIGEELEAVGVMGAGVFRALATGGIASVARLAKAKVIENLAWALENFAKSMGWIALGNVPSAAAAKKAATGHLAAAAKWGSVGAGATALSGGAGATGGASASGLRSAGEAQGPRSVTHIYIDGFDPSKPAHVRLLGTGMRKLHETDSSFVVHPRGRG